MFRRGSFLLNELLTPRGGTFYAANMNGDAVDPTPDADGRYHVLGRIIPPGSGGKSVHCLFTMPDEYEHYGLTTQEIGPDRRETPMEVTAFR